MLTCETSSLSFFWGLHPGLGEQGTQIPLEHPVLGRQILQILLGEQGTQIPLEHPVLGRQVLQILRSGDPEWELEVEPVWELGQTVEVRTWLVSVLEHSLAASPAGPVASSVWRSTYPIPEVEVGLALELGSCCGH